MTVPPLAAALLGLALALGACGGTVEKTSVINRLTSHEQEAADFQRALDDGAMTQEEYRTQMRRLGQP